MMLKFILVLFITFTLTSFSSLAEQCSINFNYGVVISPNQIRMIEHGKTIVQINGNEQLFIEGREIELNSEQQQLINNFARGIRKQLPEIVSIAIDGVDVGLKAVNRVIGGLTGENSAAHQKIQSRFDELKWRIRARFNQSANNYYIAPQDFDDFDDIFTGEFELELEEILSDSIGTILLAVGEAIISENSDSGNGEQRLSTFDDRMETMGKDLELEISASTNALKKKAEQFCLQLIQLDKIESEIQRTILPLSDFNLIETN